MYFNIFISFTKVGQFLRKFPKCRMSGKTSIHHNNNEELKISQEKWKILLYVPNLIGNLNYICIN